MKPDCVHMAVSEKYSLFVSHNIYNTAEGQHAVTHLLPRHPRQGHEKRLQNLGQRQAHRPRNTKMPTLPIVSRAKERHPCPAGTEKPLRTNSSAMLPPPLAPFKKVHRQRAYRSQPFVYVQLATKLNRFLRKQSSKIGGGGEKRRRAGPVYLLPNFFFFRSFFGISPFLYKRTLYTSHKRTYKNLTKIFKKRNNSI